MRKRGCNFAKNFENEMAKKERELPEKLEIDFVICDNTLNRYRWRLLVEGIDLEGFRKNPVACVQHDTWKMPVGRWENVRVEEGMLKGTCVFDPNDEEAVKLYWKYRDGYMNAVSLHIRPLEESDDASVLVEGQKYPTVVKSELIEVSLVTVPGQKNAVKLMNDDGSDYKLGILNPEAAAGMLAEKHNNNNMSKETEKPEKTGAELTEENRQLQLQLEESRKLNAKNLVALHRQRGVVGEGEVEHLEKLALMDYESVDKMLSAREVPAVHEPEPTKEDPKGDQGKQLAAQLQEMQGGAGKAEDERKGWDYLEWTKRDPRGLAAMEQEEPERFKKLCMDFESASRDKGLAV